MIESMRLILRYFQWTYDPNACVILGCVCSDPDNQVWSPMFDLINIFESSIPSVV